MAAAQINLEIIKGDSFKQTFTRYDENYVNFRGTWTDLAQYKADDVVIYKNASYLCILDTTASQLPTNVTYWGDLNPHDYSTSTLEAKLRTAYNDEEAVITFASSFVTDGTDGKIQIELTAVQTAALDFTDAVYDVEVTSGSVVQKHVTGRVKLKDEATY